MRTEEHAPTMEIRFHVNVPKVLKATRVPVRILLRKLLQLLQCLTWFFVEHKEKFIKHDEGNLKLEKIRYLRASHLYIRTFAKKIADLLLKS